MNSSAHNINEAIVNHFMALDGTQQQYLKTLRNQSIDAQGYRELDSLTPRNTAAPTAALTFQWCKREEKGDTFQAASLPGLETPVAVAVLG